MQGTETPPLADGFAASQVHSHIYMMQPFLHSFSMHMPNGKPESIVTPGLDRQVRRPNGAPINPTCGHTLCLGSQNRNSGPREMFNETTHCVLLHSLSSFTFV